jgi:hypothetical protein
MRLIAFWVTTLTLICATGFSQNLNPHDTAKWPSGENVCSGPWLYNVYKECAHPDNGVVYKSARQAPCPVESTVQVEDPTCGVRSYLRCDVVTGYRPPRQASLDLGECHEHCGQERCLNNIEEMKKPLASGSKISKITAEESRVQTSVIGNQGYYTTTCKFQVEDALVESKVDPSCGIEHYQACKEKVTFAACRRPEFGIERFNKGRTKACGVDADMRVSKEALSINQLIGSQQGLAVETVSCATCDGLPIETPEEISNKAICLGRALDTYVSDGSYSKTVASKMVESLSFLLQEQQDGVELYRNLDLSAAAAILQEAVNKMNQE